MRAPLTPHHLRPPMTSVPIRLGAALLAGMPLLAQATLLRDVNLVPPPPSSSSPFELTRVGPFVYFMADEPANGAELWRTVGTSGTTQLVKDIRPGPSGSNPYWFTAVGTTLFFIADD